MAEITSHAAPRTTTPDSPRALLAVRALAWRELARFVRQPNRLIGALGQPILFWFLFGAGLGPSFRLAEDAAGAVSYRDYFFPGTLVMILLFTAIFATISIIEDRREGFLQSVLVAPVPRWSMVLGKIGGGAAIALVQAMLFVVIGYAFGVRPGITAFLLMTTFCAVLAFALTSLGFVIAWRMDSTQGFHAIMSVFLLPMWLLSGAFFPADRGVLAWVMRVNPLTYGVSGVRRLLAWGEPGAVFPSGMPGMAASWMVTVGFAVVVFGIAWLIAARRTKGDLL